MDRLTPHEITALFLALAVLLTAARVFGELAQRFRQPAVLGELLAGILLGPTVLGRIAPGWLAFLFPAKGASALALDALTTLAIALFLFVAGMEVDLAAVRRQGRTAVRVAAGGIAVPFALGFVAAWYVPTVLGREHKADPLIFALFFATALSISALPVIAKTLMDLYLYRTDLGMVIIAAAVVNDLIGWVVFAVILGMMDTSSTGGMGIGRSVALTLLFTVGLLTVGRWLIDRGLMWIQAHTDWPGGTLSFALSLALFGAAFTEWIGIHAIFGAFLAGVAVGDSRRFGRKTRALMGGFISFIFAPLFFASIGLRVDFIGYFRWQAVLLVLVIACVGKLVGCVLAARLSGLPRNESWAVGFGMNARGAMEIILGLLALEYGVIRERMFVALVVMAVVTSMIGGPAIQWLLGRKARRRLIHYMSPEAFVSPLAAVNRREAIAALSAALADATPGLDAAAVADAVWAREGRMATGLGSTVAVPHAAFDGLPAPRVAVGISKAGVDFGATDGMPAHIILLVLTPSGDAAAQLGVLAEVAKELQNPDVRKGVVEATNFHDFVAAMREH